MQIQALPSLSRSFLISAPVRPALSASVSPAQALQRPDQVQISPEAREQLQGCLSAAVSETVHFLQEHYRRAQNRPERLAVIAALGETRTAGALAPGKSAHGLPSAADFRLGSDAYPRSRTLSAETLAPAAQRTGATATAGRPASGL